MDGVTQDGGGHSNMPLLPPSQGCSSLQGPAWNLAAQPGREGTRQEKVCVLWVSRDEPGHRGEQKEKLLGAPKGPSGACLWVQREKPHVLGPSTGLCLDTVAASQQKLLGVTKTASAATALQKQLAWVPEDPN